MRLGDLVGAVATPVARAFGSDCIDPTTGQPRPDSPCGKTKDALNEGRFADAFYDRFFPSYKPTKKDQT